MIKGIFLPLLGAFLVVWFAVFLVWFFYSGQERTHASAAASDVLAEGPAAAPVPIVVESNGETDEIAERQFPVGSFLGLYGGEVHICPASSPQLAWGEDVRADWTWLEATAERPAACRRDGPIGVSAIAAPGLLAIAGVERPPVAQPTVAAPAAPAPAATPSDYSYLSKELPALPAGTASEGGAAPAPDDSLFSDMNAATTVVVGGELGVYDGRSVTCAADSRAMRTLTGGEWDFAYAADSGSPGVCYAAFGGGLLTLDWMGKTDKRECLRYARGTGLDSEIVARLQATAPGGLTDAERLDWRELLLAVGGSELFAYCSMYWSEPAGAENGDKRNERYGSCVSEWSAELGLFSFGQAFRNVRMEDVTQMNYAELTRAQANALREWLDEGHGGAPRDCHLYYPQLYTGRWMPLE